MDVENEYIRLAIPNEYPWVMLVAGLIAFEVIILGFLGPGRVRGKVFTKHFME